MKLHDLRRAVLSVLLAAALLLTPLSLFSCGSEAAADPGVAALAAAFDGCIANVSQLSEADADYVSNMFSIDLTKVSEYKVKFQTSGTEIDQYGIFKAADADGVSAISSACQKYIDTLRANYASFNYLPAESVKLDSAAVKTSGLYVYYTILSASETDAVDAAFAAAMKG